MSKLSGAVYDIRYIDEIAGMSSPIHRLHPLVKLIVTVAYIWTVVAFDKYDLAGLLPMFIYPAIIFILSDVPFGESLKKLRIVLPICCIAGLFNPLFDHMPVAVVGKFVITGGMVSGVTLIIKGACAVLASYLLIATTGIEKICFALRLLHIPGILVTQILLTYRYVTVLLSEANQIYQAYSLRAPRQKGIHYKVWGSLLGQLLFRSIDRANALYDSMLLRGHKGDYNYVNILRFRIKDAAYVAIWIGYFVVAGHTDIFEMLGRVLM